MATLILWNIASIKRYPALAKIYPRNISATLYTITMHSMCLGYMLFSYTCGMLAHTIFSYTYNSIKFLWNLPKTSLYLYSWWWFHYGLQQTLDNNKRSYLDDTHVYTVHTIVWTRALRVAVHCIWNTMSGPPSMSNTNMSCENRVEVNVFCSYTYMHVHKKQLSAPVLILH